MTTAYHPQCNSQAEVANKTIAKYLASFVDSTTLEWEDLLAPLMFSYNTSYHRSVKNTPFYLTFGIEPRTPNFEAPDLRRKFYGESSSGELFTRLCVARDIARLNNEDATLTYQMQYDAKAQPHNYKEGQLVLLDEHNFLKKNVKLAPKWSGPHRILKIKGPCTSELQLDNNKRIIVNVNRLKPYHLREKHNAVYPEEEEQAWAIPTKNETKPKQKKQKVPQLIQDQEKEEDQNLLADWFASNQPLIPARHHEENVAVQDFQPVLPQPTASGAARPRGRPRKSYSEVVASNPSPIRQTSTSRKIIATPHSDLISSRTRSKLDSSSFLAQGGNEGFQRTHSSNDTTPAFIDADAAAFATAALVNPQTVSHLQEDNSDSDNSNNNEWVMVMRKKTKTKKDKLLQRQNQVFRQTGDTYSYNTYKNAVEFEYLDIPDQPAAAAAAQNIAPPALQGLPAPAQVQVQAPAQGQHQVPPGQPAHPGHQAAQAGVAPPPVAQQPAAGTSATAKAGPGNADDRPLRPAAKGSFYSDDSNDDGNDGDDDRRPLPARQQLQRGRVGGDSSIHSRDRTGKTGTHTDTGARARATPARVGPKPVPGLHGTAGRDKSASGQPRKDQQPPSRPRPPLATPPRFATVEEDDGEYEDIADTKPPEFVPSPSTPRTNARYSLRPSPAASPTATGPFNPRQIKEDFETVFREAEESLFPRASRSRSQPLPDDVLHRYPKERGKPKRK